MFQRLRQFFTRFKPASPAELKRHQAVAYAHRYLDDLMQLDDTDQVLQKAGIQRHDLRSLEFDDEISAAIETRREAVLGTPWRLEPNTSRSSKWLADELKPHIEGVLSAAFNAILYGYSVQELVYVIRDDGKLGLSEVCEKPLEWFEPRPGNQLLYRSDDGSLPVPVDIQFKFLLTRRNPTYQNPLGEALLSRLYWPWFYRKAGWQFWLSWLERFGQPFLVGKAHNPESMAEALLQARQGAAIAVGMEEEVKMESPEAGAGGHFPEFDKVVCQRIQKVVLGQTLTSSSDGKGSYALGKVHNEVREDKWRADIRLVSRSVQQIINALWALNRMTGQPPVFVLADDVGLETQRAERDAKLVPVMSASGLTFSRGYYTDRYDITDEDIVEVSEESDTTDSTQLPSQTFRGSFSASQFEPTRFDSRQQVIEDLGSDLTAHAAMPLSPEQIQKAIRESNNPEELAKNLADLIGDSTDFSSLMERALFAADIIGYAHSIEQREAVGRGV